MSITITIECDNEAFADGNLDSEVARILRDLAGRVERNGPQNVNRVADINGNKVGELTFTE